MTLAQIKTMFIEILSSWFSNKKVLDKLSENTDGNLLFDGQEIKGSSSSDITISEEDNNAIQQKDDGIFVEDKTEQIDNIHEQVNKLSIAQKTVNTELDYAYFIIPNQTRGQNSYYDIIKSVSNGIEYTSNSFWLKAGKTYKLTAHTTINISNQVAAKYVLCNKINTSNISNTGQSISVGYNSNWNECDINCIYCPEEDCEIALMEISTFNPAVSTGYITIQEIGHNILIDPVEYINTTNGIEDTPVGHIISHMGNKAPKHYLICDGTEYNISDYPYLAQHFMDEFGSYNYFGGDGTTTFAVPDLRGEFLRGTGTNSHVNQGSGSGVGIHQDSTVINMIWRNPNDLAFYSEPNSSLYVNHDSSFSLTGNYLSISGSSKVYSNTATKGTIRPTNTSILYCIKYEPTYFMNINNTGATNYSEEEQVIGTWIDGKPLYRRVLVLTAPSIVDSTKDYEIDKTYIVHNIHGYIDNGNNINHCIPLNFYVNNTYVFTRVRENLDSLNISITLSKDLSSTTNKPVYVIIEYTKTTD